MNGMPLKRLVRINARTLAEDTEPDRQMRYVDIGAVGTGMLVGHPVEMTFADAPSRARRLVQDGDTILSTVRTYLRAVLPIRGPADDLVVSTGFAVLTPGPELEPRYLGWLAQSNPFVEGVVARSVGVSYPAISPREIGNLRVDLPPLDDQRIIADYLDIEIAGIYALMAKKRDLARLLRERARSYADARLSGGRVTDLNRRGSAADIGARGPRLRRCLESMQYGTGQASKAAGAIAVYGMGNMDDDGRVGGTPAGYLDHVEGELLLEPGDLLFNRTNSREKVGKVGLVGELSEPTTFASYLVRLNPAPIATAEYLNYLLNCGESLGVARAEALPSIGQANLNPSRYSEMRVVLPPGEEQRRIVKALDREWSLVHRAEAALRNQVARLRERRQALITAAVTGELEIPGAA